MRTETRKRVYQKYNGKCAYCGCDLEKGWHVDHIKPKVIGGSDSLENFNPSCKHCNTYKGGAGIEEYRTQLKRMLNENPVPIQEQNKDECCNKNGFNNTYTLEWCILF